MVSSSDRHDDGAHRVVMRAGIAGLEIQAVSEKGIAKTCPERGGVTSSGCILPGVLSSDIL